MNSPLIIKTVLFHSIDNPDDEARVHSKHVGLRVLYTVNQKSNSNILSCGNIYGSAYRDLSLISENSDFDHLFMIWVLTFICLVDFPDEFEGRRCGPEFDSSFSCKNLPCLVLYFAFVCLILFY